MSEPFSSSAEPMREPSAFRPPRRRRVIAEGTRALFGAGLAAGLSAGFNGPVLATELAYVIPPAYRGTSLASPVRPDVGEPGAFRSVGPLGPLLRWEVRLDDVTLERTLDRWAATAGVVVRWEVRRSVLIDAPDRYEGTFEGALQAVLSSAGIADGDDPLEACIYPNSPPLVRVTRRGEQARECPEQ